MCNLLVPVGLPGSGKSTWGNTMFGKGHYSIICSDDIRRRIWGSLEEAHNCTPEEKKGRNETIWKEFYATVEESLKHNVDTYADATNLREEARNKLLDIAERTGATPHLIVFKNAMEAWHRNRQRERDKHVPAQVMSSFQNSFDKAMVDVSLERWDTYTVIESVC